MPHLTFKTRRSKAAVALVVAFLAYVGSYCYLSVNGRYEPATIGLNGVKSYRWAPRLFVSNYKSNRWIEGAYFPLYALDIRIWHQSNDAYSGRFPVHEPDSLGDVLRAWSE